MFDFYKEFLTAIFGVGEIEKYERVCRLIDQSEVEEYQQCFEEIIAHSDVVDANRLRDEWHEASFTVLKTLLKGIGVIPSPEAEFVPLLDIAEVVFGIENREDKSGILDILQDADLDNSDKFVQVIEFFSEIDHFDIALNIETVHNGFFKALQKLAEPDSKGNEEIERNPIPPLAKNVRLMIDDNPSFILLQEVKAGLALGLDVEIYVSKYWESISKLEPKYLLRELAAAVFFSNTPPHEMLDKLRQLITGHVTDEAVVRQLMVLVTDDIAPILQKKVDA